MKQTLFSISMFFLLFAASAQDLEAYQKLRGEILSSIPENDYTRHQYNAFDTNKGTGFMAKDVNGWIGLNLGANYTLQKVRIYPMPDRHQQMSGTLIQGSENPNFTNPTTLLTISEALIPGEFNTFQVSGVQSFQYIRCINPHHRVSVAELEFYTYAGNQQVKYPQLTNLPTVYLETKGNFDFINKKNFAEDSKVIVSYNGTVTTYPARVRGRGNSTWDFMEKKPFRINFDKKQNFLGMAANAKKWTLLANAVDKTLLRNPLAFEISKMQQFEYTPDHTMVDVVLDGFYYGSYMASDQLEIREFRIDIDDIDGMDEEDLNEDNITGGYHMEIDAYAELEPLYFKTPRGLPITIQSPEEGTALPSQKAWIENHLTLTENMLFENPVEALKQYIDLESAVKYYIHSELTGNCDSYWCIHCYKKRGDDKLYFGPVWDYDQAFLTNERVPLYTETLNTNHGVAQFWFRKIMQTDTAQVTVSRMWKELKNKNLESHLIDYLYDNAERLQASQALNFERWNSMNRKVWFEGALFDTYEENIDFVKDFIEKRFAWFDEIAVSRKAILPVSSLGNPIQTWQYTLDTPPDNWMEVGFNDSRWDIGQAPFGAERNLQNTEWTTNQIFIRTQFDVDAADIKDLIKATFMVFHDEDVKIYLNGELALERTGYLTDYKYFDFDHSLLHEGVNTLAVSCTQTVGGQLIDVGIYVTPDIRTAAPETEMAVAGYTCFVREGILHLSQIHAGDFVEIYTIDGTLLKQQYADGDALQIPLSGRGIYIVRVQGQTKKIVH